MASQNFEVICAIPRTGRTFENFLNKLKTFGVSANQIDQIIAVSKKSKSASQVDFVEAAQFLQYAMELSLIHI